MHSKNAFAVFVFHQPMMFSIS
jgi:hypothetical protein